MNLDYQKSLRRAFTFGSTKNRNTDKSEIENVPGGAKIKFLDDLLVLYIMFSVVDAAPLYLVLSKKGKPSLKNYVMNVKNVMNLLKELSVGRRYMFHRDG